MKSQPNETLYTISEYSRLIGVTRRTIYNWIANGKGNLEVVNDYPTPYIKVPNKKEETPKTSIESLSTSELISLYDIYREEKSEVNACKASSIFKEIDKRIDSVLV